MRYSASQTIRLISAVLIVASLMLSLIVRIPVTSAESGPSRAGELSASNSSPATGSASDEEVPTGGDPALQARVQKAYGQLPLSFEANRGQTNGEVKFLSRNSAYTLFLTPTEAVWTLQNTANTSPRDANSPSAIRHPPSTMLRMKLVGANPEVQLSGEDQLPGKTNYLKGNDPQKWQKDVPLYAKVRYAEVYAGVDMLYYGNQQQLEYDFIVSPGADPKVIALDFEGVDHLSLDADGNLVLRTGAGEVVQHAPVIYQETDGVRQIIAGRYIIKNRSEVGFEVGAYDTSRPLMIDPVVQYSTYLGGSGNEQGRGIAVDSKGNAYVTGFTLSANFPKQNPISNTLQGDRDAFVTKFTTDGSALVYSTFIGGNLLDQGNDIAVTQDGKACITGFTGDVSPPPNVQNSFPVTPNAFQTAGNNSSARKLDAFVTVLNANGDGFVYSTFYGGFKGFGSLDGDEDGRGIAVDSTGKVYITGDTDADNLPLKNGFQTTRAGNDDVFIARFNPLAATGPASLLYASLLGGTAQDQGTAIAVDNAGVAYVAGETFSDNFPTKSPSALPPFQTAPASDKDGFVAKINPALSGNNSLVYSTYLGSSGDDEARGIAVDSLKRAYITGFAEAADFPLKNPFDPTFQGESEAFVTKLDANGTSLFYSSFLGGNDFELGESIAVDAQGNAYLTGETVSATGFPILNAFQPNKGATTDAFVTKISAVPSASVSPQILFSSFLGGSGEDGGDAIALGPKKSVFVVGTTGAVNFPTTPGAFQKNDPPGFDAFVVRVAEVNDDTIGTFRPSDLTFRLRNSNTAGPPDLTVGPGGFQAGDLPVTGDFDGDGIDTTGVFRPSTGKFFLSNKANGSAPFSFLFGQAGDLPIAGDWDGDGDDTIGVFRPSAGKFFLRNTNNAGPADITVTFGAVGDIPLAGDWDGDSDDTIGIYRDSQHKFFLRNKLNAGADINVTFGVAGDLPITGDWDGDGDDTIGVFRNNQHKFFLRNVNTAAGNLVVDFGATGDVPLAGDWDGLSSNTGPNSGVNEPSEGSSRVDTAQQFVTTCSDPDGWRNIHTIDFRIAKPDGQGGLQIALWAQFDQNRNRIRLYDPDTQTWSEGIPGSTEALENRFVKLRLSGTSVHGSGPTGPSVEILWNVIFMEAAVMDDYKQYLRIEDDAGFSTGFDEVGSWSVTP